VEQRVVIKFLVGENVPSAEIHHRLQQQYGEECLSALHFCTCFCFKLLLFVICETAVILLFFSWLNNK